MAKAPPEYPYVVIAPGAMLHTHLLVCGPSFAGVRVVERVLRRGDGSPSVRDRVLSLDQLKLYPRVGEQTALQSLLNGLKAELLAEGGTHEAIRMVHKYIEFSEKELNTMATKLTTKKPAAKAAPKTAAKGAAKPAANKGNPEALKKAREASEGKRAEMNAKKIKFIGKEVAVREGSIREELKAAAKGAKTVGELKENTLSTGRNISAGDVNWMIEAGVIELVG